jgi:hypothetical protein
MGFESGLVQRAIQRFGLARQAQVQSVKETAVAVPYTNAVHI